MKRISKEHLKIDLYNMGVRSGDTIFVRATLSQVGRVTKKNIVAALLESVGAEGTVVTLGFTKSFINPLSKEYKSHIFDVEQTKPNIGALSVLLFEHPNSKRSSHPTNSFIAVGKNANYIIESHDESALAYTPIKKLIDLKSKMLLIGCVEDSPGFTTVHYNQELLGITKRSLLSGKYKSRYITNGVVKTFTRSDFGGCSLGFKSFYKDYRRSGRLIEGNVGSAFSYLIDAEVAFKIEKDILEHKLNYFFCSSPGCLSCRVSWPFDRSGVTDFVKAKVQRIFRK